MAIAILTDGRLDNTHPQNAKKSGTKNTTPNLSKAGVTYVATKRKHSKPKV